MFIRKLVISNLLVRKARTALTVAAVALSVCLVVAVTTGFSSVTGAVHKFFDRYVGTTDAIVSQPNAPRGAVNESILDALRSDPSVRSAHARVEARVVLVNPEQTKDEFPESRMVTLMGIDRSVDVGVDQLKMHAGKFFTSIDTPEIVIDQIIQRKLKVGVGGTLKMGGETGPVLKVVGVIHKPEALAMAQQEAYVPLRVLQRHQGLAGGPQQPAKVSKIYISLKRDTDVRAFESAFRERLIGAAAQPGIDPRADVMLTRDLRDSLTKQLTQVELLSYLGGAVSMAAATFIVFSALSMGVSERQRGLATLRAIGATRRQVGALVVSEGLLLCGSGALIGAPLGVMCVGGLAWWFSEIFVAGVAVSWGGLALGVFGTLLAALAASLLPAWQATRVQALEAMAPSAIPPSARLPWVVAVIGAVLVAIDPFLFFGPIDGMVGLFGVANVPQTAAWLRLVLHFVLGLPAMFIGAFLLAPVLVKLIEFLLAGPVARVLSISPMLLRQQLSTGLWRAAGTASALMVGLAVLVVLQVQGHSALSGWRLPTRFPDLFLYYSPSASSDQAERIASALPATQPTTQPAAARKEWTPWELLASRKPAEPPATATRPATAPTTQPERPGLLTRVAGTLMGFRPNAGEADSKAGVLVDDLAKIRTVPGVAGGRVMPVAIASPDFGHGLQSLVLTMASPNATMYFGIDPAVAFDMMELEFRDGDPASAKRFLTDGQAVWLKKDQTWRPRSELVGQRDGREVPLLRGLIVDDGQIAIQGLVTQSNGRHFIATPGGAVYEVPSEQVDRTEHGLFLLVTNEFKELRGIGVGDPFALKRVKDRKSVSFTAVGVIWSPGLDVITGVMDLGRQMEQRTAFSVFGSIRDAREQFGVDRVYVFGVNLDPGANPQTVVKEINRRFGSEGLRAGDVRAIKEAITTAFDRLLLLTSTVAFAALAVASLGVTNTVMASIRSRRWQFGVLRSIGVTRGQLLRLVLAEAILLGVVATALGLLVGSLMVTDARALQLLMTGYRPPIALPIWTLLIGISAVLLVALVASFWPARTVARTEPLKLLQAGRASA